MQQLRAYQEEARAAVHEQLEEHRSTLVVAATGTGKTIMFAAIARDIVDQGGRVLVLAHRSELVHQAVGKLETICGCDVGIEMAASTAAADLDGPLFGGGLKVVCATVQSMSRRLDRYSPEAFDLIVVDEAHHIVAGTYAKIIDHFAGAKVLGVTATPDRGDKKALRKAIESVAYVFDIREAISDGWLVPIKQRVVDVENLDLSEIRTVAGDFHRGQLDEALCDLACLHEMAGPIAEEVGDRQTIVFTASVAHAHALAKVLSEYTDRTVEALDGTSDPAVRADVLRRYADGDVHFLLNCALFTEGFDAPATSAIAVCRPTKSRALHAQIIGRGTRPLPGVVDGVADRKGSIAGSAKPDVLVLDFAGNAGRHTLVTAADVLGGDLSDEVIKEAKGLVAAGDYDDVLAALDAATKIIDAKLREEMRDRARRGYKTRGVDPFDVFGVVADPDPYGREATRRQLEYLERKGITTSVDYQQAKKLIDACESRRKQRLATFKQATLLLKKGLDPALVWQVSFERASKMIDALARNRWKPPHGWEALAKEEARA